MRVLAAVDHSDASEAVIKEIAARPWPAKSCIEVLNVLEHAHLWAVSETAEEARGHSTSLIHRAAKELCDRGLEAPRKPKRISFLSVRMGLQGWRNSFWEESPRRL
jgi:hypothetical protein